MPSNRLRACVLAVLASLTTGLTAAAATPDSAGAVVAAPVQAPAPVDLPTDGWLARTDGVEGRVVSQANPQVDAGVWDIEFIGDRAFLAGKFTTVVRATDRWQREPQSFVAAFDANTGQFIDSWRPTLDGSAWALDETPDGDLLIGGEFATVNGETRTGLVALDPETGETVPTFTASVERPFSDQLAVIRDTFLHGDDLYVIGNFSRVTGDGETATVAKVARLDATTGRPDPSWAPVLAGKSGWSVVVTDDGSTVHLGGEFASVNGGVGTNTYAVVDGSTGALVPGASHGLPVAPHPVWPVGGVIYDLAIDGDLVYLAGAEHFYQLRDASTGANVKLVTDWAGRTTGFNDTQVIDVFGDTLYVGCHCERRWGFQNMDADAATGLQFNSLTDYNFGGDGVWAQGLAPDGCVWMGGQIYGSSRIIGRDDGNRGWVGNIARYCGADGPPPPPVEEVALVGSGDPWRVSTAAVWPSGWTDTDFDDAGWLGATTQMGYGDGDEATVLDDANRTAAPLARTAFEVTDPDAFTHLRLRVVADDGVTVWINGKPRLVHRVDEGSLESSTLANTATWGAAERDFAEFAIDADDLVAGANTIAVSIHQAWINSADLSMDLELIGSLQEPPPLLDRPDLTVDRPATEVVLRDRGDAFRFSSQPGAGWTETGFNDAAWSAGSGIAGFGEADIDTDLGVGSTAYAWRTTFDVADTDLTDVTALIERDDGLAVWVNGRQVALDNLAAPGAFDSLATGFVWGAQETTPVAVTIDPALLVEGSNTLAVSVHQAHPDSLDLRLAVDIRATEQP